MSAWVPVSTKIPSSPILKFPATGTRAASRRYSLIAKQYLGAARFFALTVSRKRCRGAVFSGHSRAVDRTVHNTSTSRRSGFSNLPLRCFLLLSAGEWFTNGIAPRLFWRRACRRTIEQQQRGRLKTARIELEFRTTVTSSSNLAARVRGSTRCMSFTLQHGIRPQRGQGKHDANGSVFRWCDAVAHMKLADVIQVFVPQIPLRQIKTQTRGAKDLNRSVGYYRHFRQRLTHVRFRMVRSKCRRCFFIIYHW